MRLLDTSSYRLGDFLSDVPPYAILSHTWAEEEVKYEAISNVALRRSLKGWAKIEQACRRARSDGWDWIWIDTCCINKADTTELGEAINSMFRWYEAADICYAYLVDVPPRYELSDEATRPGYLHPPDGNGIPWTWCFRSSRWFRRGWTLQELLAPHCLLFLDREWTEIGARENMASEIQIATGITTHHLADFRSSSVAAKLSWAADRETTREEDRAYSLLGLFGVNMPLIYGEGSRAFLRLQKELIQNQNDESILASSSTSILGRSPEDFKEASNLAPWRNDPLRKTFSTTNVGVSLNVELLQYWPTSIETFHTIQLNCREQYPGFESTAMPIFLLLKAEDNSLELFNKWTQGSESTIRRLYSWFDPHEFKSLGRKDIFIRYQSTNKLQPATTAPVVVDFTELLKNTSWTECEVTFIYCWRSAKRTTLLKNEHLEPAGLVGYVRQLEQGTVECYSIRFTHSKTCQEHLWLVIDTSLWPPRLGIWPAKPETRTPDFVERVTSLPAYLWPNTAALVCHQSVEVYIMAAPSSINARSRRYNLTFRFVTPTIYTGAIGRRLTYDDILRERELRNAEAMAERRQPHSTQSNIRPADPFSAPETCDRQACWCRRPGHHIHVYDEAS